MSEARPASLPSRIRTDVPGGVCRIAFSTRIRTICRTRSSSPSASASPSTSIRWPVACATTTNSSATASARGASASGSRSTTSCPASSRERSSRSVASFWSRRDLLLHRREELPARVLVELLVRHQLDEAAEGEDRRAKLVRGVRDELAAGALELREAAAHALERNGQLRQLVAPRDDDGLVEAAAGDAVGGALEPPDAAREHGGEAVAEQRRDEQRRHGGEEDAPLHQLDVRERVAERRGEEDHGAARGVERERDLGVALVVPRDRALRGRDRGGCLQRDRVVLHVGRRPLLARVGDHRQRVERQRVVDDDACVRARGDVAEALADVEPQVGRAEDGDVEGGRDRLARAAQGVDLRGDEVPLEARDDDRVHDPERDRDDERQRERQLRAHAPERVHASRKR